MLSLFTGGLRTSTVIAILIALLAALYVSAALMMFRIDRLHTAYLNHPLVSPERFTQDRLLHYLNTNLDQIMKVLCFFIMKINHACYRFQSSTPFSLTNEIARMHFLERDTIVKSSVTCYKHQFSSFEEINLNSERDGLELVTRNVRAR